MQYGIWEMVVAIWDLVPTLLKWQWNEDGETFQDELLDYFNLCSWNKDQEYSMEELIWARKKNDNRPFQQAFSIVQEYLRERITQCKLRAPWNGSF